VKATFGVTIVAPSELTALSNMPCTSSSALAEDPKLTRHVFENTPLMSTYLLAFVVGRFDCIEGTTTEGTLVRCFATPGKGEHNRFALDFALKLLPFYHK
jgi:puromycin-sensitive aminopeptidase